MDHAASSLVELAAPAAIAEAQSHALSKPALEARAKECFHCGLPVKGASSELGEKSFCCNGCRAVYELLTESGLTDFYRLGRAAGVRVRNVPAADDLQYLDEPAVRRRLVDYEDAKTTRVTFHVPAMHCIACVWLLENLFRLDPSIVRSRVNFPRKRISLDFESARTNLAGVVRLLSRLGYEPDLKFSDLDDAARRPVSRRLWLQLGIAGFAFGNIMLLSIPSYFGLDAIDGPGLKKLFGWVSVVLAVPVIAYSASDYWKAAWLSWRRKMLTIEVPIALGIAALAVRSGYEVIAGLGPGYFDSLCGLLFFLLIGRLFQQKTFDRLVFDRDYKSFFPLSIARKNGAIEQRVSLSQLEIGDRLVIRNGEIIPADALLISTAATVDYSFVTGESEPVAKQSGDYLYAGGRQIGGAIEMQTVKKVSQSYLASLWNQPAFRGKQSPAFETLTNRYSRRFTTMVITIAVASALFWAIAEPARSLLSFTSVLIVACPCALALAAPFALGAAQRVLARRDVFLKNPAVIETLAQVDAVIFDKTGTLTVAGGGSVSFVGNPLAEVESKQIAELAGHSNHPYSVRIAEFAAAARKSPLPDNGGISVRSFVEIPGCGLEGLVGGTEWWLGSAAWLDSRGVIIPDAPEKSGSVVHAACNGEYRGRFILISDIRPQTGSLLSGLSEGCDLSLLSGDNEKERPRFEQLFGESAQLHFNQSPLDKLNFIRHLQQRGKTVMMVGDGLNDAGALQQSNAGVAVVESIGAFSPASDVIMSAKMVPALHEVLRFARRTIRTVKVSFAISAVYNVVGISIAARGFLSPVICAILMPVSSITVVVFACGMTNWLGRRLKMPSMEVRS